MRQVRKLVAPPMPQKSGPANFWSPAPPPPLGWGLFAPGGGEAQKKQISPPGAPKVFSRQALSAGWRGPHDR